MKISCTILFVILSFGAEAYHMHPMGRDDPTQTWGEGYNVTCEDGNVKSFVWFDSATCNVVGSPYENLIEEGRSFGFVAAAVEQGKPKCWNYGPSYSSKRTKKQFAALARLTKRQLGEEDLTKAEAKKLRKLKGKLGSMSVTCTKDNVAKISDHPGGVSDCEGEPDTVHNIASATCFNGGAKSYKIECSKENELTSYNYYSNSECQGVPIWDDAYSADGKSSPQGLDYKSGVCNTNYPKEMMTCKSEGERVKFKYFKKNNCKRRLKGKGSGRISSYPTNTCMPLIQKPSVCEGEIPSCNDNGDTCTIDKDSDCGKVCDAGSDKCSWCEDGWCSNSGFCSTGEFQSCGDDDSDSDE